MPRAKSPKNGSSHAKSAAAAVAVMEPTVASNGEFQDEIRRRAYELYEERGCAPGHEADDWLIAEREILRRHSYTSV